VFRKRTYGAFRRRTTLLRRRPSPTRNHPRQRVPRSAPNSARAALGQTCFEHRVTAPLDIAINPSCNRGKHHNSAIGIVAHKLARRVHAVLKQQAVSGSEEALYRFRRPDAGTKLTQADAVAYVRANYPSKTERARREKAAPNFPKTGSPEGATKGSVPAPPTEPLPARHSCGKHQEKLVDSP
jgi:hypothetical protein